MQFEYNFPLFSILFVMAAAVLIAMIKDAKKAKIIHFFVTIVVLILSLVLTVSLQRTGGVITYIMGHYPQPWGNEIRFGLFEAMMALLFSVIMLLAVLAGWKHIEDEVKDSKKSLYYALLDLLFASMLALIYTNDLFTAYVFIEINTIAACAIVLVKEKGHSLLAALRYLVMSLLGSGLFLIAVAILYAITGHLLFPSLRESIAQIMAQGTYRIPLLIASVLMTLGLCVKSALFPFHTWLADAHSQTTTASSSILSGLVVKSYIILLVKIFYRVIGVQTAQEFSLFHILFVMGVLGMMFGSLNAIKEKESKRMIAYSSVAQLGYIFMGIGLGSPVGLCAAFFHLVTHAFTKPLLFSAESGLSDAAGHSVKIGELVGVGRRNRLAGIAYGIGALSMVGIPLFAGFSAKWFMGLAALQTPAKSIIALVALAVSTYLNAAYYLPVLFAIYRKQPEEEKKEICFNTLSYRIGVVCFMIANIALGLMGERLFSLLENGLTLLG